MRPLIHNYFPPRPQTTGLPPTVKIVAKLRRDCVLQKKANGDRAVLWVERDGIYIQSRHGGAYHYRVRNRDLFRRLPTGTVLDCEIVGSNAFPFEIPKYGDLDLIAGTAEARCLLAEKVCGLLGLEWIYGPVTDEWLREGKPLGGMYEGIIAREKGSRYEVLGKATHTSWSVWKFKWPSE